MQLRKFLDDEDRPVHTIDAGRTIDDAVRLMLSAGAGAVVVTENDQPVGLFAQTDVFHCYGRSRADFPARRLKHALPRNFLTAQPEDTLEEVIALMIRSGAQHLPVLEGRRVVALLHLADMVERQLGLLREEIRHLSEYISDLHDAGQD